MDYQREIQISQENAKRMIAAYNVLLKLASTTKKNERIMAKQASIFNQNAKDKDNLVKYNKKTAANFKKLEKDKIYLPSASELLELLKKNGIEKNIAISIAKDISETDFKTALQHLANEYKNAIVSINTSKKLSKLTTHNEEKDISIKVSNENINTYMDTTINKPQTYNRYGDTPTVVDYIQKDIIKNGDILNKGPKSNGLFGKDNNFQDMSYLYGLSVDILALMMKDQKVDQHEFTTRTDITNIPNPSIENIDQRKEQIFNKYNVTSLTELLNRYNNIRDQYYQKYKNLKGENKKKYSINSMISPQLHFTIGSDKVFSAMQVEGFEFPPSKEQLMEMMNKRIIAARSYDLVTPLKDEIGQYSDVEYDQTKKIYQNLAKNMDEKQIVTFYNSVKAYIKKLDENNELYAKFSDPYNAEKRRELIDKIFCEVLFQHKDYKYADKKQYDAILDKIATQDLKIEKNEKTEKEQNITIDEQIDRNRTISAEYIRYKAQCVQNHQDPISFTDFSKKAFAIERTIYNDKPEEKEQDIGMHI